MKGEEKKGTKEEKRKRGKKKGGKRGKRGQVGAHHLTQDLPSQDYGHTYSFCVCAFVLEVQVPMNHLEQGHVWVLLHLKLIGN